MQDLRFVFLVDICIVGIWSQLNLSFREPAEPLLTRV